MAIAKPRKLTLQEEKEILAYTAEEFTMEKLRELFACKIGQDKPRFNTYDYMNLPAGSVYPGIPNENTKTTIGRYIFNKVVLPEKFLKKFGYCDKTLDKKTTEKIEAQIGEMLLNDELTTKDFAQYLDKGEWLGMGTAYFLSPTMDYDINVPIPEVIKRRDELFDKYKDKIEAGDNGVADVIQKELLELAKDKIKEKGNEAYDFFESGVGSFDNNYKKTSVMGGAIENPYTKKLDIIKSNYIDGVSIKDFNKMSNLTVTGGYSRGVATQQSGYERKKLDGASQTTVLDEEGTDCGTKFTMEIVLPNEKAAALFYYRYIDENGELVLLTPENAKKYIGKTIHIRTPMYCKSEKICSKCAGELFYKIGIKNAGLVTDSMAGTLMNKSMKKMHDASIHFSQINISDYISKR